MGCLMLVLRGVPVKRKRNNGGVEERIAWKTLNFAKLVTERESTATSFVLEKHFLST